MLIKFLYFFITLAIALFLAVGYHFVIVHFPVIVSWVMPTILFMRLAFISRIAYTKTEGEYNAKQNS